MVIFKKKKGENYLYKKFLIRIIHEMAITFTAFFRLAFLFRLINQCFVNNLLVFLSNKIF